MEHEEHQRSTMRTTRGVSEKHQWSTRSTRGAREEHQRSIRGASEEHQRSIRGASKEHEEHQRSTMRTTRSIREVYIILYFEL